MKLSRPAAVFAAVVVLAGGAAVAVNAATGTDPVTLCSSAKNGAVTVPNSSGVCAKGTTAISVASDAAVQALATRLGTAETDLTAAQARIAATEAGLNAADARLTTMTAQLTSMTAQLSNTLDRVNTIASDLSTTRTRLSSIESQVASLAAALQSLDDDFRAFTPSNLDVDVIPEGPGEWNVQVSGTGLKPGADVTMTFLLLGSPNSSVRGAVQSDGTVDLQVPLTCAHRAVYFRTLTDGDDNITANAPVKGPGCA